MAPKSNWPTVRGRYVQGGITWGLVVAALAGAFAYVFGGATAAAIAVVVWLVPFAIFFLVGYAKLRARFKAA